jgi:hypothetical protein
MFVLESPLGLVNLVAAERRTREDEMSGAIGGSGGACLSRDGRGPAAD